MLTVNNEVSVIIIMKFFADLSKEKIVVTGSQKEIIDWFNSTFGTQYQKIDIDLSIDVENFRLYVKNIYSF